MTSRRDDARGSSTVPALGLLMVNGLVAAAHLLISDSVVLLRARGTEIARPPHLCGMGKTATAVNLAAAIAMRGRKTLLIDLARQANGSISFLDHGAIDRSMCDAIADPACEVAQIIQPAATLQNLFVALARICLTKLESR